MQNASTDEYSTPRAKREREIAGDGPKHRAEHVDGGAARGTSTLDPGPGNLGRAATWHPHAVQRRESVVKIFQPRARKNAFGRDVSKTLPQISDHGVLPQRAPGHCRMTALARKHEMTGSVRDTGRHSKACAGAKRRARRAGDLLSAAYLQKPPGRKVGEGPRNRFKIVDQAHGGKSASRAQLGGIDHPGIVRQRAAGVLDRAGDSKNGRADGRPE